MGLRSSLGLCDDGGRVTKTSGSNIGVGDGASSGGKPGVRDCNLFLRKVEVGECVLEGPKDLDSSHDVVRVWVRLIGIEKGRQG